MTRPDSYGGDILYAQAGDGSKTASWTFGDLRPGRYRVSTTWSPSSNRAWMRLSRCWTARRRWTRCRVNQKIRPDDFQAGGVWWEDLGIFEVTGSTLVARLSNAAEASQFVMADAVRVEWLGDTHRHLPSSTRRDRW